VRSRRSGSRGKAYYDAVLMSILREEWEQLDRPRSWEYPTDGSVADTP
jgi:hypothetical protein